MEDENAEQAISEFETAVRSDWLMTTVVAISILVITGIVAHLVARFIRKILTDDRNQLPSSTIFINIARGVIWFSGICAVLTICFNVDITAGIAALGVGGIALSLGFQDTASNIISGLQVSLMKIIEPGDNISVGSDSGIVHDITWRHTTIITATGEKIIIPNSIINKQALTHLSAPEQVAVHFTVRTDGEDLDEIAKKIELACARSVERISPLAGPPKVAFTEITDFGFRGKVCFEISSGNKANAAKDAAVRAIAPVTRGIDFPDDQGVVLEKTQVLDTTSYTKKG